MIIILLVLLAIALCIAGAVLYYHFDAEISGAITTGFGIATAALILVLISGIIVVHVGLDGEVARLQAEYDSLLYQAENSLYENDNDFGKKELANQIQAWNENIARNKALQRDFWVGIFYPNIYDDFELIPMELLK